MLRGESIVPSDPWERFLNALTDLIAGETTEGMIGHGYLEEDRRPIVIIGVDERKHVLYLDEARKLADCMEEIFMSDPDEAGDAADVIMAIRAAADKAEQAAS